MSALARPRLPRRRRPLRRARTNQVPPSRVLFRGGLVVVLFVAFVYFAASLYNGVPTRRYLAVRATVPQIGNLIQHDPVRVAGIRVGQVQKVGVGAGGRPQLELQLEPGTSLPADTTVVVRANGLLGARFVQLIPGTADRSLADGARIAPARQSLTFAVPETLDTFDARTRGRLGDTLNGLGVGLAGQGEGLNTTLHRVAQEVAPARATIRSVLAPSVGLSRLVPSLRSGVAPLDRNRLGLTSMFGETDRALQPLVAERDAVRATLSAAPGALAGADAGLERGRRLLGAARSLATSLSLTLPPAPRGLRTATALLRESRTPLDRADRLLQEAGPTVPKLLQVTSALRPVLKPLFAATDDLTPMVTPLGRYGCDIVNTGTTFRSMTGFGGTGEGPNGPLMGFRLQAIAPAPEEALGIRTMDGTLTGRDGYPAPCKYAPSVYPAAITKPTLGGTGR
jgi:phospholipid/cholesterol/gamma-HCH transport system substrate-binding protein